MAQASPQFCVVPVFPATAPGTEDSAAAVPHVAAEERTLVSIAALSADVLAHIGIPFDVMLPLVDQTVRKLHSIPPADAQTGPAVRYDETVIRRQHDLLADHPEMQRIYDLLTESIHKKTMNND